MPNHCSNIIRIEGSTAQVGRLVEAMTSKSPVTQKDVVRAALVLLEPWRHLSMADLPKKPDGSYQKSNSWSQFDTASLIPEFMNRLSGAMNREDPLATDQAFSSDVVAAVRDLYSASAWNEIFSHPENSPDWLEPFLSAVSCDYFDSHDKVNNAADLSVFMASEDSKVDEEAASIDFSFLIPNGLLPTVNGFNGRLFGDRASGNKGSVASLYEDCVKRHGTKWGGYYVDMAQTDSGNGVSVVEVHFSTAWAPSESYSLELIDLIKKGPGSAIPLYFSHAYVESGMGFWGWITYSTETDETEMLEGDVSYEEVDDEEEEPVPVGFPDDFPLADSLCAF